ncbi:MAG: DUF2828 family protein [Victivallales bacterium]|nr:DUF2828 family protein [Victivallales bacterium]
MSEKFAKALEKEYKAGNVLTENGAIGYRSSGTALVDFNFKVGSYRRKEESAIVVDFTKAFKEDAVLAMKLLFLVGDIREGMGERRTFNVCLQWLVDEHPEYVKAVLPLIAEYTRWDYVVKLLDLPTIADAAWNVISRQLEQDLSAMASGKPVSLLAKWLPSVNTSSAATRALAHKVMKRLKMDERAYRKTLSALRGHLRVVEKQISANEWGDVDYNAVPSKANVLYRKAFMKHDEERRKAYLQALEKGEDGVKINAGVVFPYDIIARYRKDRWSRAILNELDATLEQMWKSLPDYVGANGEGVICVVDGSGSMTVQVGEGSVTAMDVARSLGLYFAERLNGVFKEKFITFSENPQLVDVSKCKSLMEKINECNKHTEVDNTDIEKVFDLILKSAVKARLSQSDMPRSILIISDMEFDEATTMSSSGHGVFMSHLKSLFDEIGDKYKAAGYILPRLVFWNVNNRSGAIPLKKNKAGVALVSGFSPAIASMVFSNKLNPFAVLLERLESERYVPVGEALKEIQE